MGESSGFWTTSGSPSGDQVVSYTQAHWSTAGRIMSACSGFEGVAPGYLNELAGTVGGANTVAINTGGAVVDGKWFLNDASQNVTIPSAVGVGNTRIDRIVLRASWSAFNVSVYRIVGTDSATPSAPAITQTTGTTYDIMLYQALVNTSGTVTLTDERVIANNFHHRQGGNASDWSIAGATNYIPSKYLIQSGVIQWTGSEFPSGSISVTWPVAFSNKPIVLASSTENVYNIGIGSPTTTGTTLAWAHIAGAGATAVTINWLAIGPA